eukprot:TRINITY_DN2272_c0_g1_i7.p1 TRINITY_DN2272_c0_g1~~TRINITY_DN2272_c0_g1_i7.p1  ORF type:complete len:119 (+),score=25.13 TRINITY_DN2272_c0_g1_i7:212-568(+)
MAHRYRSLPLYRRDQDFALNDTDKSVKKKILARYEYKENKGPSVSRPVANGYTVSKAGGKGKGKGKRGKEKKAPELKYRDNIPVYTTSKYITEEDPDKVKNAQTYIKLNVITKGKRGK